MHEHVWIIAVFEPGQREPFTVYEHPGGSAEDAMYAALDWAVADFGGDGDQYKANVIECRKEERPSKWIDRPASAPTNT